MTLEAFDTIVTVGSASQPTTIHTESRAATTAAVAATSAVFDIGRC
jgi:hypothetical protein